MDAFHTMKSEFDESNHETNPQPGETTNPKIGMTDAISLCADLVRLTGQVDEQSLNRAVDLATKSHVELLHVLVDRELISARMSDALRLLVDELSASVDPPTINLESTLAHLPSAHDDEITATIATAAKSPLSIGDDPADQDSSEFGDYELIEELGQGGMGVVYKARQISLNRIVALKRMQSGKFAGEEELTRFRVEAEALANLNHPGIVPIFDFGMHDGHSFFSMGLVTGSSLAEKLSTGPLDPRQAAEILSKIGRAVDFANQKGIVHRDLKPGNVLLNDDGEPLVTDFGLAKQKNTSLELTTTGQILGSPSYMPPEQAAGEAEQVDQRADVYSLGAILYATLTGRPPFQSASLMETIEQVLVNEPVSIRKLNPSVPSDLETICLKCLQKHRSKRFDSAGDFSDDLDRWLQGKPIVARRVGRIERGWKWCRRKPWVVGTALSFMLAFGIGLSIFYSQVQSTHATGLVEKLESATPMQIEDVVFEIRQYRHWAHDDLKAGVDDSSNDSIERLHLSLALMLDESEQHDYVRDRLLVLPPSQFVYLRVYGDVMRRADNFNEDVELFRAKLQDSNEATDVRFRAGLLFAYLSGGPSSLRDSDRQFLVRQFIHSSIYVQPELLKLLMPLKAELRLVFDDVFYDADASQSQIDSAANALALFCRDQPERLCELLLTSQAKQFRIIYPAFAQACDESSRQRLMSTLAMQPNNDMTVLERIDLGRQRANAAMTLLQLGEREAIFESLRYQGDPEAMTQFVHRCRDFGVEPDSLIDCVWVVDRSRGPIDGNRRKIDDSVMYALLLALGEYAVEELPHTHHALADHLIEVYAHDPSSGVHGAAGWLLRQWGLEEEVTKIDETPLPQDETGKRQWYVIEIAVRDFSVHEHEAPFDKIYFTMIDFPAGEFNYGSPENEPKRQPDEEQQVVSIAHPFSVCDRELSWLQTTAMEGDKIRLDLVDGFEGGIHLHAPSFSLNWFETMHYCNWLTRQAQMTEEDLAHETGTTTDPSEWSIHLDRPGFRQLTEQEWEYACRGGTVTAYSFGNDDQWLSKYGWYSENAESWSIRSAQLRPNPRGLFDVHGNSYEWCYDIYEITHSQGGAGTVDQPLRIHRGGSWYEGAEYSRSANRAANDPIDRGYYEGFRVGRGPIRPSTSDLPDEAEASEDIE